MRLGKGNSLMRKPSKADLRESRKETEQFLGLSLLQVSLEFWKLQKVNFHYSLPLNKCTELV